MIKNRLVNISTFLLLGLFTGSLVAGQATINGTIKNTKSKTAGLSYNAGLISYIEHKETSPIDKNGNFKFTIEVSERRIVHLIIDEQQTSFFIQPDDHFTININYSDFDNSISFSGVSGEKNNLFNGFNKKFVIGHEREFYQQLAKRTAGNFSSYCDSMLNEKLLYLENYKWNTTPDAAFITGFKTELKYENTNHKLEYPAFWSYLNKKGDTLPEMPINYYDFLKQTSFTQDSLISNDTYLRFIQSGVSYYVKQLNKTFLLPLTHEEQLALAGLILKKENLRIYYEAWLTQDALRKKEFKLAESYYAGFMKKNPSSKYSDELTGIYTKTKKISPGQPAPDFKIMGSDGKKYSLSDFRGKVIFLDFWASWCGPCLRELPYAKKIKQEFEGKNILFLYISIDEDLASWKKAITNHDIKGTHLNDPSFDGGVATDYNIRGVPSYFLIDKAGIIISNNPPRPSNTDGLRMELNKALAE